MVVVLAAQLLLQNHPAVSKAGPSVGSQSCSLAYIDVVAHFGKLLRFSAEQLLVLVEIGRYGEKSRRAVGGGYQGRYKLSVAQTPSRVRMAGWQARALVPW